MFSLQFNGHATNQDICTLMDDKCGGTNDVSFPLERKARAANQSQSEIWGWIFEVYGGQAFDDGNQTNMPSASDELTESKRVYANVPGFHALRGVAYKDSAGEFNPLIPITLEQIQSMGFTLDSFMSTAGTPQYYMPLGNSTYVFPASDTTRSLGFKQYYDRGTVSFASTATTETPGIVGELHDCVAVGGAYKFAKDNTLAVAAGLENEYLNPQNPTSCYNRVRKFYKRQFEQMFPPRIAVRDMTKESM